MTNLVSFPDFCNEEIRVTEDEHYSVYDVIRFCGKGGERKVWKRLTEQFPEVVAKCHYFKFSGRGQRETPVANRENILYIIGLLPGAVGRAYREDAAKVFIQYLDASPELAGSVIDRATPKDLERIEQRLRGKKIRVAFTATLQEHGVTEGWQFGSITNTVYKQIMGGTAKQIRQSRNLPAKANIREHATMLEDIGIAFAEELSKNEIEAKNSQGYKECNQVTDSNARKVRNLMDGN